MNEIDENKLLQELKSKSHDQIIEYAFKYLKRKEYDRLRIKRLREKRKNEKN